MRNTNDTNTSHQADEDTKDKPSHQGVDTTPIDEQEHLDIPDFLKSTSEQQPHQPVPPTASKKSTFTQKSSEHGNASVDLEKHITMLKDNMRNENTENKVPDFSVYVQNFKIFLIHILSICLWIFRRLVVMVKIISITSFKIAKAGIHKAIMTYQKIRSKQGNKRPTPAQTPNLGSTLPTQDTFDNTQPNKQNAQSISRVYSGFVRGCVCVRNIGCRILGIYIKKCKQNPYIKYSSIVAICMFILWVTISMFSRNETLAVHEYQQGIVGKYQLASLGNIADSEYDNMALSTPFIVEHTIKKGDSLTSILTRHNVGNRTATINAMGKVFSSRYVAVGQKLKLGIIGGDTPYEMASVVSLELIVDKEKSVFVKWDKNTNAYDAKIIKQKLSSLTKQKSGEITLSLSVAMDRAGIMRQTINQFINLFSFDTDFQRDIYKGDTFDIRYKEYIDKDGNYVKSGDILVAELSTLGGNRKRYYYYTDAKGNSDYYDHTGKSGRKALMKTPIEGARLSSNFGKRKHPILGYTKMHKGTDFAAPSGTPIFAAGDGVIERAGRNGSFGIYIRIRHNGAYKTAYAHLKGVARGIRTGTRVRQGQVIGFVGTTGRSTGPHLHYEVIKNGVHINSRTLKLPSGKQLKGTELAKFKTYIRPHLKDGI